MVRECHRLPDGEGLPDLQMRIRNAHPVSGRITVSTCWQMALLSAATAMLLARADRRTLAFHMAEEAARFRNV